MKPTLVILVVVLFWWLGAGYAIDGNYKLAVGSILLGIVNGVLFL